MSSASFQSLSNFIWSVADLLRGPYRPPQYERVMLPMTVLRRFDSVLEASKPQVLKKYAQLQASGKITNVDSTLNFIAKDKNGESLVSSHEEDDEAHEVQGDLQEGGRTEEGDCGSKEDLARVED